MLVGEQALSNCRKPEILGEAAYRIVTKPVSFTGNFVIDDSFQVSEGVTDLDAYSMTPGAPLFPDSFVPEEPPAPEGVVLAASLGH